MSRQVYLALFYDAQLDLGGRADGRARRRDHAGNVVHGRRGEIGPGEVEHRREVVHADDLVPLRVH